MSNTPLSDPGQTQGSLHQDRQIPKEKKETIDKKNKISPYEHPLEVIFNLSTRQTTHKALQLQPPPEYLDHRIRMFNELKAEYDHFVKGICDFLS